MLSLLAALKTQKDVACPEAIGHAVVDAVGREPVHALDLEPGRVDRPAIDVAPSELILAALGLALDRADEARVPLVDQGEEGKKAGVVEEDVKLRVHRAPPRFDVSDVEDVIVGPAGEARADGLAHRRASPVAARDEARSVFDLHPSGARAARNTGVAHLDRTDGRPPFDADARDFEVGDEHSLVFVLRIDHAERKGAHAAADARQIDMDDPLASSPEVHVAEDERAGEDVIEQANLPIEFERSRLDSDRTRRGARFGFRVHDAHPDAELGQEQREEEPGRPSADNENVGGIIGHASSIGRAGHNASPCGNAGTVKDRFAQGRPFAAVLS